MNVTSKPQMYELLRDGKFGNTVPNYRTVEGWVNTRPRLDAKWGIRSGVPGGRCFLNVNTADVPAVYHDLQSDGYAPNISPMVDHMRTGMFNVWESSEGLNVECVLGLNPGLTWREAFSGCTVQRYAGIAAHSILSAYLNVNSLTDLWQLFYDYPYHVIELTTLDRCFGLCEHRNAIVWEVRNY